MILIKFPTIFFFLVIYYCSGHLKRTLFILKLWLIATIFTKLIRLQIPLYGNFPFWFISKPKKITWPEWRRFSIGRILYVINKWLMPPNAHVNCAKAKRFWVPIKLILTARRYVGSHFYLAYATVTTRIFFFSLFSWHSMFNALLFFFSFKIVHSIELFIRFLSRLFFLRRS